MMPKICWLFAITNWVITIRQIEIFKSMLKENPMNVNLLLNSARCYEKLNDKNSALELLNKVVESFPECEEAQEMIRAIS